MTQIPVGAARTALPGTHRTDTDIPLTNDRCPVDRAISGWGTTTPAGFEHKRIENENSMTLRFAHNDCGRKDRNPQRHRISISASSEAADVERRRDGQDVVVALVGTFRSHDCSAGQLATDPRTMVIAAPRRAAVGLLDAQLTQASRWMAQVLSRWDRGWGYLGWGYLAPLVALTRLVGSVLTSVSV